LTVNASMTINVPQSIQTDTEGRITESEVQTDRTVPNNKIGIIIRDFENEHVC
jgi:hypothetical protein